MDLSYFWTGFYKRANSYAAGGDLLDDGVNLASKAYSTGSTISNIPTAANVANKGVQFLRGASTAGKLVAPAMSSALKGAAKYMATPKVPLLGGVVSGALAANDLRHHDLVGAGIDALSGAVSSFPVLGTAASVGLDIYNEKRKAELPVPNPAWKPAGGGGGVIDTQPLYPAGIPQTVPAKTLYNKPQQPVQPAQPVLG